MRKYAQEAVKLTAGKRIHGTGSIPGGINKHLTHDEGDSLLTGTPEFNADTMVKWAEEGVALFKDYHRKNFDFIDKFAAFPSSYMSLIRKDGAMDLYHGNLRAVDHDGHKIFDQVDYQDYTDHIAEEIETWTYMKFPYFRALGREKGWYRVGPLARLNTCDFIPSPLAQKEFEEYRAYSHGKTTNSTMHTHWARLIEALHAAEVMRDLLRDSDLYSGELVKSGTHTGKGVGVIEAPRGTLFHQYSVDSDDLITKCTLLVSTTSNNEGMNRSVGWVADNMISGKREIPEAVLNQVEVALRAYDPCLSCATHAVGQMPLEVSLYDRDDRLLARVVKNSDLGSPI
jgi:NAD-reducing hydrogenase large subunit